MRNITKGNWCQVGMMIETDRDDLADVCCIDPAIFCQDKFNTSPSTILANGLLIAAAPRLLKVLRKIVREAESGAFCGEPSLETYAEAKRAIAMATR